MISDRDSFPALSPLGERMKVRGPQKRKEDTLMFKKILSPQDGSKLAEGILPRVE